MAEDTKIAWATHTFSPWIGCRKVHAGCANCYAEAMSGRMGVLWGEAGTRRRTAESTWKRVDRWNRQAACYRPRVFPSLCDVFEDRPELEAWRRDFFALIDRTPNLDWLLLTKRPQNVRRMWPEYLGRFAGLPVKRTHRENVWLLYSASDQETLELGVPDLLACRDLVPVLGLSLEPLIGPILMRWWLDGIGGAKPDWVIVGGESGPHARPMEISWLGSIVEQCVSAVVPLFVKQDCGVKSGQQGRIHDRLWWIKQFPQL